MSLENLTGPNVFISALVNTNPESSDPESQGDDHLRGIKNVLKNTFPNITGAVTLTQAQLNAILTPQIPIGAVIDWAGNNPPTGYLALPFAPSTVSRTTYAALYAAIGDIWGAGNGTTTFGLPWVPFAQVTVNNTSSGGTTTGALIAHNHNFEPTTVQPYALGGGSNVGLLRSGSANGTSVIPSPHTTSVGGAYNLPAGVYMRKIIRAL